MSDRPRMVIGSNVFDSVEDASASTSTIAGTVFAFGDLENGMVQIESNINFKIVAKAATQDDLHDRVIDVLEALEEMRVEGISVEHDVGAPLFEVDPATVDTIEFEAEKQWGYLTCTITVQLEITEFETGGYGKSRWQYQRNSAGRGFIVGTMLHSTRAAAVAAAAPLIAGSARPVWMPASAKCLTDLNEFEAASGTIGSLPDTSYRPGEISLVFEVMAGWMFNNSAFADAKRAEFRFVAALEGPLNIRAGNLPGLTVRLSGMVEFKTEHSTTYDPADVSGTVVASTDLRGRMDAIVKAAKAECQNRLSETVTWLTPLASIVSGEDGVYEVLLEGITGGDGQVLEWDEQETYNEEFRGQIVDLADGSDFEFEHPGGDRITLRHSVRIVSLKGSRAYPQPQSIRSFRDWRRVMLDDDVQQVYRADHELPRRVEKIYRRNYVYLNRRGNGGGSQETAAAPSGDNTHIGQFG